MTSAASARRGDAGFTLVELLVVVVILGILAAIAIPRFLTQQERARNASAVSDLRNLVAIETALEATTGLSDDAGELAAAGWDASDDRIRGCAQLSVDEDDLTLTVWHLDGDRVYTYVRSAATITSNEVPITDSCTEQAPGSEVIWPVP